VAGTGASVGTSGVSTTGLAGAGTNGLLDTSGVSVVPDTTGVTGTTSGNTLLNGALVSTDGTGTGTTGLLSTSTTAPDGTTNTASVTAPAPLLGTTTVLPSGTSGGSLVTVNGGTTSTSTNGGLVNGVLSTTGVTQ
jgi:hypothetical protein